jgi:O-antigen biosynthesis protein
MRHKRHDTTEARAQLRAPAAIVEIDLAAGAGDISLPTGRSGTPYRSLYVLVSRAGEPLGVVTLNWDDPTVSASDVLAQAVRGLGTGARAGSTAADHAQFASAPGVTVSVVVTTCAMPRQASRCVASILAGAHPPLEVIVVENRPDGSRTAETLRERFKNDARVRYVEEPSPGLSRARNAGLRAARGEIVAFTDDDVVADRRWLGAIAASFAMAPDASCVTGPILPLALDFPEQVTFEQFATLGKGFQRQVYVAERPPADDPLFPYAAGRFGTGANIAMRAQIARAIAGFDVHLGAGTVSRGGEDLDLFIRILRGGGTIVYEPRALLHHEHGRSHSYVRSHAFNYGVGLTAMLTKQLLAGEDRFDLLRRIPAGLRYELDPASHKNAGKGSGYPKQLDWLGRLGMIAGPLLYLASRRRARAVS